jgi:hypothetical protein
MRIVGCRIGSVFSKYARQLALIVGVERPVLLPTAPAEQRRTFTNAKASKT